MSESDKMKTINEVVTTYDKLAILDQTAVALQQTRALLNEQQHYIEKAFKNGLTIDLNRQKIQLAIEQLSVREYEIESNKKLLFIRLEELTGFLADSAALLHPELQIWQTDVTQGNAENRPDIKAIDEAILATGYKQKSELAEYIPKVVAVGKKELITSDLSMLDPEWYVGVAVRWTIFDGMAAKTSSQQAKIDKLILERRRDDAVQLAQLNLKKTEYDFQRYMLGVSSAKKQVELAQSILSLSKKQFEQGLITPSEYMTAIVDLEKSRLDYIQALTAQRAATASYLYASGNLTIDKIK
jgi:outer membrane protein TolC